jgi:hypothetical protein
MRPARDMLVLILSFPTYGQVNVRLSRKPNLLRKLELHTMQL